VPDVLLLHHRAERVAGEPAFAAQGEPRLAGTGGTQPDHGAPVLGYQKLPVPLADLANERQTLDLEFRAGDPNVTSLADGLERPTADSA
jgi:hypothetical protein